MMLPTHALAGMVLAVPIAIVAPEHAPIALSAGLLGGILPDLDLYTGHRKTLHYPVYYSILAGGAAGSALLFPSTLTVGVAVLLLAAAVHSVADIFGGGLELRPWEATSDRAVYNHYTGRWIPPRRVIRYDGSPGDFLLSAALAAVLWSNVDGPLRSVVLGAVAIAVVYTATRRLLPGIATILFGRLLPQHAPPSVLSLVPERYLTDAEW